MCLKTVKREVYSAKNMPRDPKKIDDAYEYMRMQEIRLAQMETQEVIDAEANQVVIDTEAQQSRRHSHSLHVTLQRRAPQQQPAQQDRRFNAD